MSRVPLSNTRFVHIISNRTYCASVKPLGAETSRIGWIGTGIMGSSMCKNLLKNGGFCNVSVFNRTKSKAEKLVEEVKGTYPNAKLSVATSPKEIAARSDIVFSIVGFPKDVEQIVFGDDGMMSELKNGKIFVDCTTSRPSLAKQIATQLANQHAFGLDAPVSGGDVGAKNGTLSFMIGGNKKVYENLLPCFKAMGSKYEIMGDAGQGQHTKMVNQILIASGMMGLVEGLAYAKEVHLDQSKVIELLSGGAAGSWSLSNYGPRIVKRDFNPGFYIEHFLKDLNIALEEANELNLKLPGLSLATQLYEQMSNDGYGKYGTQALQLLIEKMGEKNPDEE